MVNNLGKIENLNISEKDNTFEFKTIIQSIFLEKWINVLFFGIKMLASGIMKPYYQVCRMIIFNFY